MEIDQQLLKKAGEEFALLKSQKEQLASQEKITEKARTIAEYLGRRVFAKVPFIDSSDEFTGEKVDYTGFSYKDKQLIINYGQTYNCKNAIANKDTVVFMKNGLFDTEKVYWHNIYFEDEGRLITFKREVLWVPHLNELYKKAAAISNTKSKELVLDRVLGEDTFGIRDSVRERIN